MPRSRRATAEFEARRSSRRADPAHETQQRTRIAQVAARYVAEHAIDDWTLAKRKAARELGLPDRVALPADDEVATALAEYHALFGGDDHPATLRAQREEALAWMRRLAAYAPRLTGGVAAGWATEHSDIHLELVAPDAKAVELALINAGVRYRALAARGGDAPADLFIDTPRGGVRLVVRTPNAARQVARDTSAKLDAAAVEALLEEARDRRLETRG